MHNMRQTRFILKVILAFLVAGVAATSTARTSQRLSGSHERSKTGSFWKRRCA